MNFTSFRLTRWHILVHSSIGIVLALILWFPGLLNGLEGKTYDLRASLLAGKSSFSDAIVVVVVDQESIDWVSENMYIGWPWPRELFGAVITNCVRRGADAIGFDVLFTENSTFGVSDDEKLKEAMQQAEHFALGSVFVSNVSGNLKSWPADLNKPQYTLNDTGGFISQLSSYPRATFPIPDIISDNIILANVQQQADRDGIYRKLKPFVLFDSIPLPSLGIGVYLASHPEARITVQANRISIDDHIIPLDSNGAVLLNYRPPQNTYRLISAAAAIRNEFRLINNEIDPKEISADLAGKYVFFGYTAPGLRDLRPAPTSGSFSGVEINATLLDNLLAEDFIKPATTTQTILRTIMLTLAGVFFMSLFQRQRTQITAALFILLVPIFLAFLFYKLHYDFKLVPIELAVVTTTSLLIIHRYLIIGRQEKFIRHSFQHYLSPSVIDQLMENPDTLKLGGERKELSIFFSDLEGFTSISEGLEPEELTQLLNEYLTEMTDIILEEEGTVDKFEGDAIIAFWNAPLEIENHAEHAVRAALRCQRKLAESRPRFLKKYGRILKMRIGVNTGYAVAGNMGSSRRFDYTVLGDAANLAARLEGANKQFGTYTMISEATFNCLSDDFICRELARIRVVGRREPVRVYEPLAFRKETLKQDFGPFRKGLELYYAGKFQQARVEFLHSADWDEAAERYAQKCQKLSDDSPEIWEGVWELETK